MCLLITIVLLVMWASTRNMKKRDKYNGYKMRKKPSVRLHGEEIEKRIMRLQSLLIKNNNNAISNLDMYLYSDVSFDLLLKWILLITWENSYAPSNQWGRFTLEGN